MYTREASHPTWILIAPLLLPKDNTCGMVGGISFPIKNFTADLSGDIYYHAGLKNNLPTAIFRASFHNLSNMTMVIGVPFNHDQSADPLVVETIAGKTTMFYDIDDNTARRARIRWARKK